MPREAPGVAIPGRSGSKRWMKTQEIWSIVSRVMPIVSKADLASWEKQEHHLGKGRCRASSAGASLGQS
jgi:hypothetical protein